MKKKHILNFTGSVMIAMTLGLSPASASAWSFHIPGLDTLVDFAKDLLAPVTFLVKEFTPNSTAKKHASSFAGMNASIPTATSLHKAGAQTNGQTLNNQLSGKTDTFSNKLEAYKTPEQYCSNGVCHSTTSSLSLTHNNQYNSTAETNAAHDYTKAASGSYIGIPALPKNAKPTPEAVNYAAYHATVSSTQSISANHLASQRAARTVSGDSLKNGNQAMSPLAFKQHASNGAWYDKGVLGDLMSIPILGWLPMTFYAITRIPNLLAFLLEGLEDIGLAFTGALSMMGTAMHYISGNILHAAASQSTSSTPKKIAGS